MIDKERLKRLVKRVKRIPEAGNGGEALLFLLQGNVKRAWPQRTATCRAERHGIVQNRPEQGPSRSTNAPHHFRSQLKAFGPIDAATGVRQNRTPAHRDGPNKLVGRPAGTRKL